MRGRLLKGHGTLSMKRKNMFYYVLGLFTFTSIFALTECYISIHWPIQIVCMACFFYILYEEAKLVRHYTNKGKFIFVLCLFFMYLAFRLQDTMVFLSIPFIFHARRYDSRKTLFVSMSACLSALFIIVFLSQLDIIHDYVLSDGGDRMRHLLGFRYALVGPAIWFNIQCVWIYLKQRRLKWYEYLVLMAVSVWFFYMTRSRLLFISSLLVLFVSSVLEYWYTTLSKQNWLKWILVLTVPFAIVSSFYAMVAYDGTGILNTIDVVLENRIQLGQQAIESNGIHLLQNDISLVGNELDYYGNLNTTYIYTYVDNFYVQFLLRYGLIAFVIFTGYVFYKLYKLSKKQSIFLLMLIGVFVLHGIIDDLVLTTFYNSFLLLLFKKK